MNLKITLLFDNVVSTYTKIKGLKSMWGFSAFIEFGSYKILFDTGSNGRVLKKNAELLGINLADAQILFISHPHWDHIGGWDTVLEENPNIQFIVPYSLSSHLVNDLRTSNQVSVIYKDFVSFNSYIYSSGTMEAEGEQALILNYERGLVLIVGCSHPKVESFMLKVKKLFPNKAIFYVIGGFHMLNYTEEEILHSLEKFDTQFITPTHCTRQLATDMISKKFGHFFIPGGLGSVITF